LNSTEITKNNDNIRVFNQEAPVFMEPRQRQTQYPHKAETPLQLSVSATMIPTTTTRHHISNGRSNNDNNLSSIVQAKASIA
jgi:hypothetical protein